jgi:hypothetical protein
MKSKEPVRTASQIALDEASVGDKGQAKRERWVLRADNQGETGTMSEADKIAAAI